MDITSMWRDLGHFSPDTFISEEAFNGMESNHNAVIFCNGLILHGKTVLAREVLTLTSLKETRFKMMMGEKLPQCAS